MPEVFAARPTGFTHVDTHVNTATAVRDATGP
jgi:hypothetical protein